MAIFADIKVEPTVQIGDKTRIDGRDSFTNNGEVFDLVEIAPDGVTFIDVTANLYLDTVYNIAQTENPIVRVTSGLDVETKTLPIEVITAATDNLFSNDAQLQEHEDDILRYVRDGRSSYLDKHRLAQSIILNELDKNKIWKRDGSRYIASDIVDLQEFTEWSKYLVLKIVFQSLSNDLNDIFQSKSNTYDSMAVQSSKRAILRLDVNNDGTQEETEKVDIFSGILRRGEY